MDESEEEEEEEEPWGWENTMESLGFTWKDFM